jgi:hypothetical protein
MKFNYFDSLLVYVMSVFIRYSLCTLCYIYKDKENYGISSEVHKTITAGGAVLKSILILHLADVGTVGTVPVSRWCEDSKKEKYLSISIRKITPEFIKLRVLYAASSETILPLVTINANAFSRTLYKL